MHKYIFPSDVYFWELYLAVNTIVFLKVLLMICDIIVTIIIIVAVQFVKVRNCSS